MRKLLIVILMIYIVSNPLFSRGNPNDLTGVFVLQGDTTIRVSIDTGWERGGWIPVFLTFGGLEVRQRVKADDLAIAAGIETGVSKMVVEDMNLDFLIYEHNPLRTRMMLLDKGIPLQLKFKPGNKRVEFYIGNNRLSLDHIRVTFAEIKPGEQYELTFAGPNVRTHTRFIYIPHSGMIYAARRYSRHLKPSPDPDNNREWSVWAVKIESVEGRVLNREEKK